MHYFFCNAYLHLYYALDLEIIKKIKVIIITRNSAIYQLCKYLNKEVIWYVPLTKYATFRVHKELQYLYKIKNEVKELIEKINFKKGDIVIYPSKYFPVNEAARECYLLMILSKVCDVYISNQSRVKLIKISLIEYIHKKKDLIFLSYIKLLYFLVYGIKFSFFKQDRQIKNDTNIMFGINIHNSALKNLGIWNLNPDYKKAINNVVNKSGKFISGQYDHLIVYDGDGAVDFRISISSIEDLYNYLFSKINSYAIKRTPKILQGLKNQLNIDIENNYNCLPAFFPSELLFNNINKTVISISSSTLINASYNNLKAVSLLELVSWHEQDRKLAYKKILLEKGNNIYFPKCNEELIQLLTQ